MASKEYESMADRWHEVPKIIEVAYRAIEDGHYQQACKGLLLALAGYQERVRVQSIEFSQAVLDVIEGAERERRKENS